MQECQGIHTHTVMDQSVPPMFFPLVAHGLKVYVKCMAEWMKILDRKRLIVTESVWSTQFTSRFWPEQVVEIYSGLGYREKKT